METMAAAWLAANGNKFAPNDLAIIRQRLEKLDSDKAVVLSSVELKDPTIGLVICIFLGCLGIHRFWLKDTGMGILELLTCGLCGILAFVDLFTIMGKTRKYNYNAILPFI